MPRIREIELDGLVLKISPLSYDEAEQYINEGQDMLKRDPKPTEEDWAQRTLTSVVNALNKAAPMPNGEGDPPWNVKKLTTELDMVMINHLYKEFMVMSGLLTVPAGKSAGEAPATSISR
jgi:hypothetical protein